MNQRENLRRKIIASLRRDGLKIGRVYRNAKFEKV